MSHLGRPDGKPNPDKIHLLIHLLKDGAIENALVFTKTKHGADKVAKSLLQAGIKT
jgi:ATP-dependent RNA helicase RhlE